MATTVFIAKIQGTRPLLQHRFDEQAEASSGKSTRHVVVQQRIPRDEAERVCYRFPENGGFFIPGAAFARLLREAGGAHKLKGSRKSAKFVVPAATLVMEDAITLTNGDGKTKLKDFEVDSRPVTIPATKGRIMRHRPRFDCWSCEVPIRINTDLLSEEFVHKLLVDGGEQIGVGDFRPERGGPFGTFRVVGWERLKN